MVYKNANKNRKHVRDLNRMSRCVRKRAKKAKQWNEIQRLIYKPIFDKEDNTPDRGDPGNHPV